MKVHTNSMIKLKLCMDCLTVDGENKLIEISQLFNIQVLVALGLELQEDIYNDMEASLYDAMEKDDSVLAALDIYFNSEIIHPELDSEPNEEDYFYIDGSEFIERFRTLHKKTT